MFRRIREWVVRAWHTIRPGPEAARGASLASIVASLAMAAWVGSQVRAGLTTAGDIAVTLLVASLALVLSALLAQPALGLLRAFPARTLGVLIASTAILAILRDHKLAVLVTISLAVFGASLASFRHGSTPRRFVYAVLLFLSGAALTSLVAAFIWAGFDKDLADAPLSTQPRIAALDLPNPADPGPFKVIALTYGAGADRHRPEFGASAALKSRSVDGSKILKAMEGWRGIVRKWYWGFGADQFPLNARVWMPDAPGPFPLVLIVHGNHLAQDFSDPGYEYLGRHLAGRGFILASVDENFLNAEWSGDYRTAEQPARGWLLLEHLKLWRDWTRTKGHRLEGKADLSRIALMGHSRGGEAAATATAFNRLACYPGDCNLKFDYGFDIRSVIAIAPSDGQYKPAGMWRPLKDVNYFVIQGGFDADVSSFDGSRQYNRVSFSPNFDGFKAELWIYRANHGQFNSVWGRWDDSGPGGRLLNLKPLLSGEQQRQVAKVYFTAFLDATLNGKREYLPLFEDYRAGARWLPDSTYANRYQDARFRTIAGFDEDFDLSSPTIPGVIRGENLATWKEQRVVMRHGDRNDNGVYLGWRKPASYTIELNEPVSGVISFSLADANEDPPKDKDDKSKDPEKPKKKTPLDLTVELIFADGKSLRRPLREIGPVYAPLRVDYRKFNIPGDDRYPKEAEAVLQRYTLNVTAPVKAIGFRFDRSPLGTIVLDEVGVR